MAIDHIAREVSLTRVDEILWLEECAAELVRIADAHYSKGGERKSACAFSYRLERESKRFIRTFQLCELRNAIALVIKEYCGTYTEQTVNVVVCISGAGFRRPVLSFDAYLSVQ